MPMVIEVVSDSEEERKREFFAKNPTIIEISSSEDDQDTTPRPTPAKSKPLGHRATRNIIESSSESEGEVAQTRPPADVIDLTLEDSDDQHSIPTTGKGKLPARLAVASKYQSLYSDSEDSDGDVFEDAIDDSILTYDPPKSEKKPIRTTPTVAKTPSRETAPKKRTATPKQSALSDTASPVIPSTPRRAGKISKRAQAAAERKELEEFAQQFFDDLNKTVFGNGLPSDTKLAWNTRLLTTAGRARWHKNRYGEESSQIELATKILTSQERIRNTLSHEMCHLASWVIDKQPNEGHGQIFKRWGSRVMKAYPDVEITTRHTYEISYKYEWRCTICSKIYGRHSKSINPDECLCGACRTGKLVPLFATRTPQKAKNSSSGKMVTSQPRDSPLRAPGPHIAVPTDDDPSDFLDDLTAAIQGITI